MNRNDVDRFANAFGTTCEIFGKESTPLLSKAYFDALKNFTIEEVEDAFSKSIGTLKFFPKPVELIEFISGPAGKIEDIATQQATLVLETIRREGAYRTVKFADCITNAVILKVYNGWVKICEETKENDINWFIKDFAKYYKSFAATGQKSDSKLIGLSDAENSKNGFDLEEPVLIGYDDQKLLEQINTTDVM